jgi:hypothetical protein
MVAPRRLVHRSLDSPDPDTSVVRAAVDCANAPASTRMRAVDSVLDHARQAMESEDVEVRIAAPERAAEAARESQ